MAIDPENRGEEAPAEDEEREEVSLLDATGGPIGIAESTLPFIAFTIAWLASGRDVTFGAVIAVGITAALAILRLIRRETLKFTASGLVGVAVGAFVASRTGDAEDFFLPGILINAGSAGVYILSILFRRPLLGLILSPLTGEGSRWYKEPERRQAYARASWIWVGLFAFRLSIQVPLYLSGAVAPLAAARVVTGLPLYALAIWLSYLILRPVLTGNARDVVIGRRRTPTPPGPET